MKVSISISNEVGFQKQEDRRLDQHCVYKQVAKAKLYLLKTQLFMTALDANK